MRPLLPRVALVAIVGLVLAGCAATASSSAMDAPVAGSAVTVDDQAALIGEYTVEVQDTESDYQSITGEVVTRQGEVTGSCSGDLCDLTYSHEAKAPDGSVVTVDFPLSFDGEVYVGSHTSSYPCDGITTLTTIDGGLVFSAEVTITPTSTAVDDGELRVTAFDEVTVEHNEITAEGIAAGCRAINLVGQDPYTTNATTVGTATRN